MNLRKLVVLSVSALAVLGSTLAEARHGHRHSGARALLYAAPFIAAGALLASRPYYRPSYYYPPSSYYYPPSSYYYPPAPIYYQSTPPVYIERAPSYSVPQQPQYYAPQPQSQQQPESQYSVPPQSQVQPQTQPQSWYFCAESQAYYPNVQSCPGGWQRHAPQ